MSVDLNIEGPHSGDYSREVAAAAAEAIRVLCHASIGTAPGLEYASDVDAIVGSLRSAAAGTAQLLGQLAGFIGRLEAELRLGDDRDRDPRTQAAMAAFALGGATTLARQLEAALGEAARVTSHMQTLEAGDG